MFVQVGDVKLFFDVEGAKLVPDGAAMLEKPTLLLLHGGPGFDHSLFKPAFSALAERCQVVYLDHRGQGRSEASDPSRWNLNQWADDIHAFCHVLGIEKPIVLGQSFGGFVALNYALRHPSGPGKLILSSTTARMRLDRAYAMFDRLGGNEAREVAERFWTDPTEANRVDYARVCLPLYARRGMDADARARVRLHPEVGAHFIRHEMTTYDLRPGLESIACPVLVIAGELDPITPVADAMDLVAALPQGSVRLEVFADAGHGVFRDAPERFVALVDDFIGSAVP